ncbi:N-acetyltransferase family protein [Paenibacillus sp. NEAU-GSW1]|uniref:GNAT family N-acetyltransferase n=1 Tax=Paenibacillus sp. NEAU-GSW1 TaxID=2682486 RepID=UPI003464E6B6
MTVTLEIEIRRLDQEEVPEVLALMEDVASRLPNQGWFAASGEDYLRSVAGRDGELYGAYHNGVLVAFTTLAFPGLSEDNLGREFGVPEEELHLVAALDATVVHEAARGQGLQRLFHQLREEHARELGYRYLFSTVHPDNSFSWRNLEAAGLSLQFSRPMYGGLPRRCYAKRLDV